LGPLLQDDKIFRGVSSKVMGGEKNFSMLVQDSLPIDIDCTTESSVLPAFCFLLK
jgi:hypothetical protein